MSERRRFILPPGYTQIPNELLEEVLRDASLAELRVTLMIARRTFGFGIPDRLLTNAELCELCNLSRQSVTDGLKAGEKRGFIGKRNLGGNRWAYGIRVKNLGSQPPDQLPKDQEVDSLETRKFSIQEKQNPPGRKQTKAPASGASAKKPRNGDLFKADPEKPGEAVIVEVFDAWAKGTGCTESAQLTIGRASKIRARLQEAARLCPEGIEAIDFARAQLLEAVKGMATSKWHEQNDQQDFTQLFRNRERIEFFLGRLAKTGKERDGQERFAAYEAAVER